MTGTTGRSGCRPARGGPGDGDPGGGVGALRRPPPDPIGREGRYFRGGGVGYGGEGIRTGVGWPVGSGVGPFFLFSAWYFLFHLFNFLFSI